MEIKGLKIKNQDQLIDATIEVVNGVMVVSPKDEKIDITKFKDGDVITCGHHDCGGFQWTAILQGEIERIADNMFIGDYCSLDSKGEFLDHNSNSDAATWVRYATEQEKQKLFDKMKEEGLEWDANKKELVKLRWKPENEEEYYTPFFDVFKFILNTYVWEGEPFDFKMYDKGWVFQTEEDCEQFCSKLNKAIENIKP